jgi:signal transduction histidine kinase
MFSYVYFQISESFQEQEQQFEQLNLAKQNLEKPGSLASMPSFNHKANLQHLQNIFWGSLLPLMLIGLLGGFFLSNSTLSPVRDVINSLKKIETGNFSTRVPLGKNNDELEELKFLFNRMLDKIENLVSGLKEAFDHLAHDIRTPVTRLRGRAEIALNSEGDVDSYREALQSCFENSDRILVFLQVLTDITEAENRSKKLKLEKRFIGDIVQEMMGLYEMAFEDKKIEVVKNLGVRDWAMVDSRLMSRVIANLLDNALKYTPEGGTVTIETINNTESVDLKVTDTGTGISPEEHGLIWQKLYRSDKARSADGLGLGLTFVKAIVEAHEGKVAVCSPVNEGHGTQFTVTLQKMA